MNIGTHLKVNLDALKIQVECFAEHETLGENKKAFIHVVDIIGGQSSKYISYDNAEYLFVVVLLLSKIETN